MWEERKGQRDFSIAFQGNVDAEGMSHLVDCLVEPDGGLCGSASNMVMKQEQADPKAKPKQKGVADPALQKRRGAKLEKPGTGVKNPPQHSQADQGLAFDSERGYRQDEADEASLRRNHKYNPRNYQATVCKHSGARDV